MKQEDMNRMWDIDQKTQLGDNISIEEMSFFNEHHQQMIKEMKDKYDHWKNHTGRFIIHEEKRSSEWYCQDEAIGGSPCESQCFKCSTKDFRDALAKAKDSLAKATRS